ncbi:MAG: cation:proton antiporter [Sulfuricurvum sp.]
MGDATLFFITLAVLIIVSPMFSNITKLPIAVIEILLGSLAVWVGLLEADSEIFKSLSKIGFFYLMFLAGLEIDLKKFVAKREFLLKKALTYFVTIYLVAFIYYLVFDLNPIYIIAIPIVSLGMVMALINEQGKGFGWLEIVLIVGVMGEILSITAIVIYKSVIYFGLGFELYKNIAIFLAVLYLMYQALKLSNTLFWWYPELKESIMPQNDSKSQSVRVSVALFIILIGIMNLLHIDMVLGAFFAGIFIANFFEHKKDLPHTLHKVGFGFLVPLFFIYVGSTLDLNLVFSAKILTNAFLILLAIFSVRFIGANIAHSSHLSPSERLLLAFGDSMPLTFLIAISTIGYEAELITKDEYLSFVLAGMLSGIVVMSIIKALIGRLYKKDATSS